MTVRELRDLLEYFDENMEVRIGMEQRYGSDFAYSIEDEVEVHKITPFYSDSYNAVVLKMESQVGTVNWYGDEDE